MHGTVETFLSHFASRSRRIPPGASSLLRSVNDACNDTHSFNRLILHYAYRGRVSFCARAKKRGWFAYGMQLQMFEGALRMQPAFRPPFRLM